MADSNQGGQSCCVRMLRTHRVFLGQKRFAGWDQHGVSDTPLETDPSAGYQEKGKSSYVKQCQGPKELKPSQAQRTKMKIPKYQSFKVFYKTTVIKTAQGQAKKKKKDIWTNRKNTEPLQALSFQWLHTFVANSYLFQLLKENLPNKHHAISFVSVSPSPVTQRV